MTNTADITISSYNNKKLLQLQEEHSKANADDVITMIMLDRAMAQNKLWVEKQATELYKKFFEKYSKPKTEVKEEEDRYFQLSETERIALTSFDVSKEEES